MFAIQENESTRIIEATLGKTRPSRGPDGTSAPGNPPTPRALELELSEILRIPTSSFILTIRVGWETQVGARDPTRWMRLAEKGGVGKNFTPLQDQAQASNEP